MGEWTYCEAAGRGNRVLPAPWDINDAAHIIRPAVHVEQVEIAALKVGDVVLCKVGGAKTFIWSRQYRAIECRLVTCGDG